MLRSKRRDRPARGHVSRSARSRRHERPHADGDVAPGDALDVINHINAFGESEGEGSEGSGVSRQESAMAGLGTSNPPNDLDQLTALLAFDIASQPKRRR